MIDHVRTVLTDKTNPFADYTVRCKDGCEYCHYQDDCYVKKHQAVGQIIDRYVESFDYTAAMNKIELLFHSL